MRVSIVGTGYVGLVSGVCLASKGHDVTCVDVDEAKVQQIMDGVPPIHEEGLEDLPPSTVRSSTWATSGKPPARLARPCRRNPAFTRSS